MHAYVYKEWEEGKGDDNVASLWCCSLWGMRGWWKKTIMEIPWKWES
jgi:hypothetical protein